MDTKEVHPADAFGKRNGPATVPMRKILEAVDEAMNNPKPLSADEPGMDTIRPRSTPRVTVRADNRLEEISRLLLSLPFGEMLKLAEEMVKSAPPLEEGKAELPDHIRMAMSLDVWAKSKMEERDAFVRETPTTK